MLHPKPRMSTYLKIIAPLLLVIFFTSCKSWDFHTFPFTHIKKYPKNKLFVYKTNIRLSGNLSKTEKSNLESRLRVQLEDSLNPRASQKILWHVIKKPPVFDTTYVQSSRRFMLAMLHTSGYFKANVTYDTLVNRNEEAYKLTLNFNVTPGPLWHFDSVWYSIQQPELQHLADSSLRADTTKKHKTDSITIGVLQPFQKLADSTGNEAVNPLEQIEIMKEFAKEKENPTATLEIKLRPGYDTARLTKYYVGKIYIFPDFGPDTVSRKDTVVLDTSYTVIYSQRLFKPKILPQNIYIRHGQVYRQQRYINTVNRFNANVAWRLVNIEQRPRPGTDTVDFYVKLIPAKKYLFVANLEGSRNDNTPFIDNNNAFAQGNLLGIGVTLSLQNRNFARAAAQTNTTLRYGTELSVGNNQPFVASRQASVGYNIVFPKIIPHFSFLPERFREAKTILAFNLANTQRINLYNLTTFNASWSYELQRRNKFYAVKIPNIEYSLLDAKSKLKEIFLQNPGLKNIFNDGLVISVVGSFTLNEVTKKHINTFKANLEVSGFLPSLIKSDFIQKNLYRFVKPDAEFKRVMKTGTSDFVVRIFTGIGIPVKIDTGNNEFRSQYLPFFKAYSAGGPNSMRGWGLRRLGPGHTLKYVSEFPDRFGDIQFEANLEYRFFLFQLFGFKFNGAMFTDIGNVWFLHKNPDFPGGEFTFSSFLKDLGIDAGTGIRLDLGFFLVRLDYALKVHNPTPEPVNQDVQNRYFYNWNGKYLIGGVLQFGVTYPF